MYLMNNWGDFGCTSSSDLLFKQIHSKMEATICWFDFLDHYNTCTKAITYLNPVQQTGSLRARLCPLFYGFVHMCLHAWLHMWPRQTPTLVALSVCLTQTFCECVPSSSQLKHRWSDSETARETPAKVRPPVHHVCMHARKDVSNCV